MTWISRTLLLLNALAFIGTGILTFCAPDKLSATVGLQTDGPTGLNELLANFGGLYLLLGLAFLAGLKPSREQFSLAVLAVSCGGLALGRVVSLIQHGSGSQAQLFFLAWECVTCGFAVWLALRSSCDKTDIHESS